MAIDRMRHALNHLAAAPQILKGKFYGLDPDRLERMKDLFFSETNPPTMPTNVDDWTSLEAYFIDKELSVAIRSDLNTLMDQIQAPDSTGHLSISDELRQRYFKECNFLERVYFRKFQEQIKLAGENSEASRSEAATRTWNYLKEALGVGTLFREGLDSSAILERFTYLEKPETELANKRWNAISSALKTTTVVATSLLALYLYFHSTPAVLRVDV